MPATRKAQCTAAAELGALSAQAAPLIDLGVHELAGVAARDLRELARAANDVTGLALCSLSTPTQSLRRCLRRCCFARTSRGGEQRLELQV